MVIYRHTQVGKLIIALTIIATVVAIPFALKDIEAVWIPIIIGAVVLVLLMFASLTVEMTNERLKFWFGVGLIHKSVAIADIASCREVKTSFLWGWGIRWTPYGWLYNISGLKAVEIVLKSGKKFRLGTDEPKELCEAITKCLNKG